MDNKMVCAECFVKQNIKEMITEKGVLGKCDYCHSENVNVLEVNVIAKEALIEKISVVEPLERQKFFMNPENIGNFIPCDSDVAWSIHSDLDRKKYLKAWIHHLTKKHDLGQDILEYIMLKDNI